MESIFVSQLAAIISSSLLRQVAGGTLTSVLGLKNEKVRTPRGHSPSTPDVHALDEQAHAIATALVREGLATGMLLDLLEIETTDLPDGNTAKAVMRLRVSTPFVFKLSDETTLRQEAALLRRVHERKDLPESFRNRFPKVYASKDDSAPYAYLMQYFDTGAEFSSMKSLLVSPPDDANSAAVNGRRIADAVADALFSGFTPSITRRYTPSVQTDYLERMFERMAQAERKDAVFRARPIFIKSTNTMLEPWTVYIDRLRKMTDQFLALHAPFSTFVHGDPNPENVLLSVDHTGINVKFIDPKEWEIGDWLFDITKLNHYLEATGPAEQLPADALTVEEDGETLTLGYELSTSEASRQASEEIRTRAAAFANEHDDFGWQRRYELGMAANLLGLPASRLPKHRTAALVLYAEGVSWLARCVNALTHSAS